MHAETPTFRPRAAERPGRCIVGWSILLLAVKGVAAQFVMPQATSVRSQSGQFIIHGIAAEAAVAKRLDFRTNESLVQLEPTLLTVSCERVKQVLSRELGATAPWRAKIYLALYPASNADEPVTITSQRFRDGWQYRVDVPDAVERGRYVRSLVQVLLQEMANRNAGERCAELPTWLVEGFSEHLLASSEMAIILPPPRPQSATQPVSFAATNVMVRRQSPLTQAHSELCSGQPLSFDQLSWPTEADIGGSGAAYRGSAQLFVHELLRLKDGRTCLRTMLAKLPESYNWQFAFLQGFKAWFGSPLDVEKWWALRVVNFTGRELAQTWPLEESWEKLNQVVHAAVELRIGTNELPLHTEVSLQTIIREWDYARQTPTLLRKLRELQLVRVRIAEKLLDIVDGYRQAIEQYLEQREKFGLPLPFAKKERANRAVADAVDALHELDKKMLLLRSDLEPIPSPPPSKIQNAE